ncbi:hypothetical protein KFK09_009495 [Dendrobium nobile]|uniref:Solute carrier family 40 member n=1 Tax=Dendrobium nobile TaxID=94219 RepID=A0A8T3BJH0_DENNO|nr:hypothetical protein KFK09_009495 [Dendrobium nobile]
MVAGGLELQEREKELKGGGFLREFGMRGSRVNPSIIGGFSGLSAFMGVAATFISATLVEKLGILKAGAAGLVFQSVLLATALGVFCIGSVSSQKPLFFFLLLIVLSRLGHMSYDVVGTQILQTGIPLSKANLIGATEISIASLAEFAMLGVAIIANDVKHFSFLALLSFASVVGAAWMFCCWLGNPSEEQRELFSLDPQFQTCILIGILSKINKLDEQVKILFLTFSRLVEVFRNNAFIDNYLLSLILIRDPFFDGDDNTLPFLSCTWFTSSDFDSPDEASPSKLPLGMDEDVVFEDVTIFDRMANHSVIWFTKEEDLFGVKGLGDSAAPGKVEVILINDIVFMLFFVLVLKYRNRLKGLRILGD